VANLLFALVMLFTITDESDLREFEYPQSVVAARMRREDMLAKHLRHSYSDNVAREKLAHLAGFVGVAKDFYAIHRRRVFDDASPE